MKKARFTISAILIIVIAAACALYISCVEESALPQPYLVLYAFDAEGELMIDRMEIEEVDTVLGREVQRGFLAEKQVVLAEVGMGLVNASMRLQKLLDLYRPHVVIFSGIAGALDTGVSIGDIVICDKWATHDYIYLGPDSSAVMNPVVYSPELDSMVQNRFFEVDDSLFEGTGGLDTIKLDSIGERIPQVIIGGTGVSGNQFIDNKDKRLWLNQRFDALIVDMESSAIAQTCYVNDVPFIIFRSASDLAGGAESETASKQLQKFLTVAADNSSTVVLKYLEGLE